MYRDALKHVNRRAEQHHRGMLKKQDEELREASFRPKLVSKQLYARNSGERPEESLWFRLGKSQMKKAEARAQKENQLILDTNNFTPVINRRSVEMLRKANGRRKSVTDRGRDEADISSDTESDDSARARLKQNQSVANVCDALYEDAREQ